MVIMTAIAIVATFWVQEARMERQMAASGDRAFIPQQRLPVSIIGDSYTVGVGASSNRGYIAQVCRELDWQCQTDAQRGTGYTTSGFVDDNAQPYAARLGQVIDRQPSVVVVQGGTFDSDASFEAIAAAAQDVFSTLTSQIPAAKIIAVGTTNPPGIRFGREIIVRDAIAYAAANTGVAFVDPIAEGWLDPTIDYITADNLHPNDIAYEKYAQRWIADMRTLGAAGPA
ncbi:SGNH/GDSL hydrolase family protein [Rhodococcus sp. NPDC078407]|uniref:SGNH/GDSL hydrolase family protein n=1 Tax=Rhodococcus sp. NPDC078407 TaxID=3364509 RepID=UPI0037CC83C1